MSLQTPPWQATVPRELVHKRAVSEVFLTALGAPAPGSVVVHAQWPSGNQFYRQAGGSHYGINAALECIRQACVAATHTTLSVDLDDQFIMLGLTATLTPSALVVRAEPTNVILQGSLERDGQTRTGRRIAWAFTVIAGGIEIGTGRGDLIAMDRARYEAMRATQMTETAARLDPSARGRHAPQPTPHEAAALTSRIDDVRHTLNVDQTQANYFDHPLDHVPGMLMIDGSCEVARHGHTEVTARPAIVTAVDVSCRHFAELIAPCTVEIIAAESVSLTELTQQVSLSQSGVQCCTSRIRTESI
ncbi:AfsA-related hotdog domain-containing protein [Gordonia soli]|uniref:Putative gamma-butyrolactone biosynthesis enzyme n=1 Tax=Gordonia soli NBRC 108243 TaxID=1223545 RepID=M0QFV5_9ACTN|nr:AfsA-related hotdog domain-containing protein [Gordonia soli]GAC67443.1 putative gamma-butyrolactone biosynthesis enzyme [Gordonia soli NBRC 108243]